jgi:hypothetical protein
MFPEVGTHSLYVLNTDPKKATMLFVDDLQGLTIGSFKKK